MAPKMNVEVMLRETIRPLSPTPECRRYHHLSLLDQIKRPILMPLIFFYSPTKPRLDNAIVDSTVNQLKESLARTLTMYYPLAGRIKDDNNSYTICNDEGVPYVQARVDCDLDDVVNKADASERDKLLPCKPELNSKLLLTIQVSVFACTGISIGVCMNHKVSDAFSFFMFVKTWTMVARNQGHQAPIGRDYLLPSFDAAKLFPSSSNRQTLGLETEEVVTKWFVFSKTKLAALKSKVSSGNEVDPASTGLVLLAFVYSRIAAACSPSKDVAHVVFQAVNVRSRIDQPPPANHFYFGNLIVYAMAKASIASKEEENLCSDMVDRMRESMMEIDTEFLRKMRECKEDLNHTVDLFRRVKRGEIVSLGFSNYGSLPTYESDFGWGSPVWVTPGTIAMKNAIFLIPSACGKQIQVHVSLSKRDMNKLENDKEFKSFVMPTLSSKL